MTDQNKALEGAITGVAKEVYSDLIRPSASPIGEAFSGIVKAVAFYPRYWARALDISLEFKTDEFKKSLYEKIERIPENKRILPPPNILGPSIQALEYAIVEDELSDLFSSLIASSMDDRKQTHPSFVEFLRQISPDEARILRQFDRSRSAYFVQHRTESGLGMRYSKLVDDAKFSKPENFSFYVDNLCRLGLLEISSHYRENLGLLIEEDRKDEIPKEIHDLFAELQVILKQEIDPYAVLYDRLDLTHLGNAFLSVCIREEYVYE